MVDRAEACIEPGDVPASALAACFRARASSLLAIMEIEARARDKVLAPLSCFGAIFVLRPLCCLCCGLEARGSRKKQKKKSLSTIWRETHPTMRDDTLISTATAAGLTQAAPEEATEAAAVAEEATADAAAAAAARLVN